MAKKKAPVTKKVNVMDGGLSLDAGTHVIVNHTRKQYCLLKTPNEKAYGYRSVTGPREKWIIVKEGSLIAKNAISDKYKKVTC